MKYLWLFCKWGHRTKRSYYVTAVNFFFVSHRVQLMCFHCLPGYIKKPNYGHKWGMEKCQGGLYKTKRFPLRPILLIVSLFPSLFTFPDLRHSPISFSHLPCSSHTLLYSSPSHWLLSPPLVLSFSLLQLSITVKASSQQIWWGPDDRNQSVGKYKTKLL